MATFVCLQVHSIAKAQSDNIKYQPEKLKIMNFKNLGKLVFVAVFLTACQERQSNDESIRDYSVHKDEITIQENSSIWKQIKIDTVHESEVKQSWSSVGTVRIIPANNASISVPFSGRIINSYVKIGQKVNRGTPLFSLHSADFYAAQKELADSKIEYHQAKIQLDRQKDLVQKGVGVQRELEEAEALYSIAQSSYENNKAFFRIFGTSPEQSSIGKALTITSPISGEIIMNQISIGQYLKDDDDPIIQIASLDKVWIEAQVKEKDFGILNQIGQATITTDAFPDLQISGMVKHINEVVDEDTRSIQILIECDNNDKKLKPGMFVNVQLQGVNQNRISIPNTAIMQASDSEIIFKKTGENTFKKVKIKTERNGNNSQSLISDGLNTGDIYIREGGIYLMNLK